jgi:hypothetical protein
MAKQNIIQRALNVLIQPKPTVLVPWKGPVSEHLTQYNLYYQRVNLKDWENAIVQAQATTSPRRSQLMRLYRGIINDPHLASVLDTRIARTMSRPYKIVDDAGMEVRNATAYFAKPWFREAMRYILEAPHYGFSLIEIEGIKDNMPTGVRLIVRDYVQPENGLVTQQPGASMGLDYTAPPLSDWCFYAGNKLDLGTLLDCAPYIIMKKTMLGYWANHAQIFGIPFRMGRTNISDPGQVENMKNMLNGMGSAGWGVFNSEDSIEFVNGLQGDPYKIYLELCTYADNQISKRIVGGTGITDEKSFTGAAGVHENGLDALAVSDAVLLEQTVNNQLLPLLTNLGISFEGLRFAFDTTERIDQNTRFTWTLGLINAGYKVPAEYITENFGIEVEEADPQPIPLVNTEPKKEDDTELPE